MNRLVLALFLAASAASVSLGLVTQVRKNLDFRELCAARREPGDEFRTWSCRILERWGPGAVEYVRDARPGENPSDARCIAQFGLAPVLLTGRSVSGRVFLDFQDPDGARQYAAANRLVIVEELGGKALAEPAR